MENTSIPHYPSELNDDVSPQTEELIDTFLLIFHAVIFLLGAPGNLLILRVYWAKIRKTSTHVLIMALAWADLAVCLLKLLSISKFALGLAGAEIPRALNFYEPVEYTTFCASMLITAVIAADRYDCICRPHRRFFTPKRGKISAWAAAGLSLIISMPHSIALFGDIIDPVLTILNLTFNLILLVITFVMIVVCYRQVYVAVRRRVKVDSFPDRTTHDIRGLGLESKESARIPPHVSTTDKSDIAVVDKAVSTLNSQPKTSSSVRHTNSQRINKSNSDLSLVSYVNSSSSQEKDRKSRLSIQTNLALQKCTKAHSALNAVSEDRTSYTALGNRVRRASIDLNADVLQRKTTRMLFITSMVFLLTWLPYLMFIILDLVQYGGTRINPVILKVVWIIAHTAYTSNAVNPLIYGLANRRFRKDCREVFNRIRS